MSFDEDQFCNDPAQAKKMQDAGITKEMVEAGRYALNSGYGGVYHDYACDREAVVDVYLAMVQAMACAGSN